jgi:hypothetical protein
MISFRKAVGLTIVMAAPWDRIQKWSCQESLTVAVRVFLPARVVIFWSEAIAVS